MYRSLLLLLLRSLLVCKSLAKPANYETSLMQDVMNVGSPQEFRHSQFATEVQDLLGSGGGPRRSRDSKENTKNASGQSDEGGYYRTYGSDAEGEKGYLKETYSKGDQGYKTFDTFHKQGGDKYGFEKHVSYGKGRTMDEKGSERKDHEGAGTVVDSHYVDGDGGESAHYNEGDDGHYFSGYGERYTGEEPKSESYSESYSDGNGDEGSYESHSSYSSYGQGDSKEGYY